MRFKNETEEKIKVVVELPTNLPKSKRVRQFATVRPGEKIDCKSTVFAKAYEEAGLTKAKNFIVEKLEGKKGKKKKAKEKPVVEKPVEPVEKDSKEVEKPKTSE